MIIQALNFECFFVVVRIVPKETKTFTSAFKTSEEQLLDYINRRPPDVDNIYAHYIYFSSLEKHPSGTELYKTMEPQFNQNIAQYFPQGTKKTIDDALAFLDQVIASEYNKERNFLQYLQERTKTFTTFQTPALDENWNTFVKDIQNALGAGSKGITAMQNELLRLQKQNARRGNKANISQGYEQDQITKLTAYADMLNKFINHDMHQAAQTRKLSKEIYGLILSKYGDKLITVEHGQPVFNRTQLLSLMQTISSIILHEYVIQKSLTQEGAYRQFNEAHDQFDLTVLENILNDTQMNTNIETMIKKATVLPWYTDSLSENLGLVKSMSNDVFSRADLTHLQSSLSSLNECHIALEELGDSFLHLYDHYTIPESAFRITSNGNIYSEAASAINSLLHGSDDIFAPGISGAKPDSIWAFVNIDVDRLLDLRNSEDANNQAMYKDAVARLSRIHSTLYKLSHEMRGTNTLQYYKAQQQAWNEAIQEIYNELNQLESLYQLVGNCYIIEDSTKNYIALYGKTVNRRLHDSMHGGALGPNIQDQINKLAELATIGGISFPSIEWLISAVINSSPEMIAANQKNKLESYFAAFATILMFDDQLGIVSEAYNKMLQSIPKGSVNQIHLFSVNDGYYPLSYILQLTRKSLVTHYQEAEAYLINTPTGGAQVTIEGYVKEPQEAFKNKKAADQWDTTRQTALAETKLHFSFLVGFLNVLENLFPDIK